jgi:hypothetical protein
MDCPRCGTRLTRISLNGEFQSVYCERCRFADIESDHTSASAGEETWDDALRRFRTANAEDDAESEPDNDDAESEPDNDAETEPNDEDPDGGTETEPNDSADATAEDPGSESDHSADDTEAEES